MLTKAASVNPINALFDIFSIVIGLTILLTSTWTLDIIISSLVLARRINARTFMSFRAETSRPLAAVASHSHANDDHLHGHTFRTSTWSKDRAILGQVSDPSGAAVVGATARVEPVGTGLARPQPN